TDVHQSEDDIVTSSVKSNHPVAQKANKTIVQDVLTRHQQGQTDVTNKEEVDELMKNAQQTFGGLDIVINSAGQMLSSKITDYQIDEWDSMIDVNSKGTLYTAQAALPTMLEQSSGHLINSASFFRYPIFSHPNIPYQYYF
uniref:SDR family NAD(P)-dependent oxidoreductase n=1 Tax=Staphylococcus aureus TaxID=1280 RepID=UPI00210A9AF6